MPQNEKGQAEARPIPKAVVYHDTPESKASPFDLQVSVLVRRVGIDAMLAPVGRPATMAGRYIGSRYPVPAGQADLIAALAGLGQNQRAV